MALPSRPQFAPPRDPVSGLDSLANSIRQAAVIKNSNRFRDEQGQLERDFRQGLMDQELDWKAGENRKDRRFEKRMEMLRHQRTLKAQAAAAKAKEERDRAALRAKELPKLQDWVADNKQFYEWQKDFLETTGAKNDFTHMTDDQILQFVQELQSVDASSLDEKEKFELQNGEELVLPIRGMLASEMVDLPSKQIMMKKLYRKLVMDAGRTSKKKDKQAAGDVKVMLDALQMASGIDKNTISSALYKYERMDDLRKDLEKRQNEFEHPDIISMSVSAQGEFRKMYGAGGNNGTLPGDPLVDGVKPVVVEENENARQTPVTPPENPPTTGAPPGRPHFSTTPQIPGLGTPGSHAINIPGPTMTGNMSPFNSGVPGMQIAGQGAADLGRQASARAAANTPLFPAVNSHRFSASQQLPAGTGSGGPPIAGVPDPMMAQRQQMNSNAMRAVGLPADQLEKFSQFLTTNNISDGMKEQMLTAGNMLSSGQQLDPTHQGAFAQAQRLAEQYKIGSQGAGGGFSFNTNP